MCGRRKPLRPPRPVLRAPQASCVIAESGARLRHPAKFHSPRGELNSSPARTARLSQPASRHPALGNLFDYGPEAQGTTGEQAAHSSRQHGPTKGGLEYAAVVACHADSQQPSGTYKPQVKGSGLPEPAASSETAHRRLSTDMSGRLSGMLTGTTSCAHVVNICEPAGERPNKTTIFITGVNDTCDFLA
jgi:hypothetical protein